MTAKAVGGAIDALLNEILPIIKKQPGFIDAIALTDDTNPVHGITLVFWATKNDLERFYGSPQFKSHTERSMPLLESVTIHTCKVDSSTFIVTCGASDNEANQEHRTTASPNPSPEGCRSGSEDEGKIPDRL